jgi:hypothetical protein
MPRGGVPVLFRAEDPSLAPYAEQLAAFKAEKGVGRTTLSRWSSPSTPDRVQKSMNPSDAASTIQPRTRE